jgi:hypothetical protein
MKIRRKYKRKHNISGLIFTVLLILALIFLVLNNMTGILDDAFKKNRSGFVIETIEPPTGLWAKAISETEVNVGWSDELKAERYYIYYTYDESGFWEPVRDADNNKIRFTWNDDVIYKFKNLAPGTEVYIKIQGVKEGRKSEYSDIVMVQTFKDITTFLMKTPPFRRYKSETLVDIEPQYIELEMLSEKENKSTDEIDIEKWFKDNSLELNEFHIPEDIKNRGDLPDFIKMEYRGAKLLKAIKDKKHFLLVYGDNANKGRYLLVLNKETGNRILSLDFKDYAYSTRYEIARADEVYQGIKWATIEGDTLYISHAQDSYAKYSYYMTGYITAIDLRDMQVLWRSSGIVANSYNFTIYNDIIISAYGYSWEEDFLFLINKYTGGFYRKIKIKTAATYLITKGDNLYVRAYDTDYVFSIKNTE